MITPEQVEAWGDQVDAEYETGWSNEWLRRFAEKVRAEAVEIARQWDHEGDVVCHLEEWRK